MQRNFSHPVRRLTLFVLLACGFLPGCYAEEAEDGLDESTESDQAVSGSYPVGTTLQATAALNLRKGPSTGYAVLDVVASGATVKVVQSNPSNGFYNVSYRGVNGWCSGSYLKQVSTGGTSANCNTTELNKCLSYGGGDACYGKWGCSPSSGGGSSGGTTDNAYNAALGDKLATAARNGSAGYSMGRCYSYVWQALRSVLGSQIESLPIPATSAYQFGEWVINNPSTAKARLRLVRTNTPAASAPRGSVIVWPRGVCGYNYTHGHIEIAQGNGTACSDFCGTIKSCTAQVFMPVY